MKSPAPLYRCVQSTCSCGKPGQKATVKWTTAGGIFAALGVCAACCLLPFLLAAVGGAAVFISALDALASYKWYFISVTAALLGYGFYVVYWKPSRASAGTCSTCAPGVGVRVGLWAGVILAMGGMVFEYFEPMLG